MLPQPLPPRPYRRTLTLRERFTHMPPDAAVHTLDGLICLRRPAPCRRILSLRERFQRMQATAGLRITIGKSAIHGWGAFAKLPHGAGGPGSCAAM